MMIGVLAEIGWNDFLNGSLGFVGSTVLWLWIYVKFILPREDRKTQAVERLADALKIVVVHVLQEHGSKPEDIISKVEELRK